MRLGGASSDVDDALDDIVNNVQADYFVDKATNKTVKKSLKPGYARSRFEKVERKSGDLMSELYDHIHEDRSEERPTASVWYNDDTRAKTFEIEDAHTLHPTGPRSESHESINPSLREARRTTGRANALHETMRYAPNPGPRWVEDDHSDSESDDDDNGRMEKLHTMMESAQKAAEVYYGCGRKCTPEEKKDALQNAVEAMITFMEESRDVTDVAFEAEFMTSRSEYNETLGYLNSLLTELTANSGGAPKTCSVVYGVTLAAITCLVGILPR
jgi:hypothetical protein